MAEQLASHNNHEAPKDKEQLDEIAHENKESMRDKLERAEREHRERSAETSDEALHEAKDLAESSRDKDETTRASSPAERRRGPITKKQLDNSFASQMTHTRAQMGPASRTFSKIIHAKPVEKISDAVGSTIARPNALLSASITAFLAVTILYLTAKHYGFQLSGFETIGAFIVGWIFGILYDYFAVMIRGHKD